jgi:hypothetical protein
MGGVIVIIPPQQYQHNRKQTRGLERGYGRGPGRVGEVALFLDWSIGYKAVAFGWDVPILIFWRCQGKALQYIARFRDSTAAMQMSPAKLVLTGVMHLRIVACAINSVGVGLNGD